MRCEVTAVYAHPPQLNLCLRLLRFFLLPCSLDGANQFIKSIGKLGDALVLQLLGDALQDTPARYVCDMKLLL